MICCESNLFLLGAIAVFSVPLVVTAMLAWDTWRNWTLEDADVSGEDAEDEM